MSKFWIGSVTSGTQTSAGLHQNIEIYHNNSGQTSTDQKFDVTVVDRRVMAISDNEDIWEMRWVVVHESFPTLTASLPADNDDKVHGIYPWAKGPVYFNPRAKLSVPPDHKLFLQVNKSLATVSSTYGMQYRVLFVTH